MTPRRGDIVPIGFRVVEVCAQDDHGHLVSEKRTRIRIEDGVYHIPAAIWKRDLAEVLPLSPRLVRRYLLAA